MKMPQFDVAPNALSYNTMMTLCCKISVKISVWPKFKRGGELNPF